MLNITQKKSKIFRSYSAFSAPLREKNKAHNAFQVAEKNHRMIYQIYLI